MVGHGADRPELDLNLKKVFMCFGSPEVSSWGEWFKKMRNSNSIDAIQEPDSQFTMFPKPAGEIEYLPDHNTVIVSKMVEEDELPFHLGQRGAKNPAVIGTASPLVPLQQMYHDNYMYYHSPELLERLEIHELKFVAGVFNYSKKTRGSGRKDEPQQLLWSIWLPQQEPAGYFISLTVEYREQETERVSGTFQLHGVHPMHFGYGLTVPVPYKPRQLRPDVTMLCYGVFKSPVSSNCQTLVSPSYISVDVGEIIIPKINTIVAKYRQYLEHFHLIRQLQIVPQDPKFCFLCGYTEDEGDFSWHLNHKTVFVGCGHGNRQQETASCCSAVFHRSCLCLWLRMTQYQKSGGLHRERVYVSPCCRKTTMRIDPYTSTDKKFSKIRDDEDLFSIASPEQEENHREPVSLLHDDNYGFLEQTRVFGSKREGKVRHHPDAISTVWRMSEYPFEKMPVLTGELDVADILGNIFLYLPFNDDSKNQHKMYVRVAGTLVAISGVCKGWRFLCHYLPHWGVIMRKPLATRRMWLTEHFINRTRFCTGLFDCHLYPKHTLELCACYFCHLSVLGKYRKNVEDCPSCSFFIAPTCLWFWMCAPAAWLGIPYCICMHDIIAKRRGPYSTTSNVYRGRGEDRVTTGETRRHHHPGNHAWQLGITEQDNHYCTKLLCSCCAVCQVHREYLFRKPERAFTLSPATRTDVVME